MFSGFFQLKKHVEQTENLAFYKLPIFDLNGINFSKISKSSNILVIGIKLSVRMFLILEKY